MRLDDHFGSDSTLQRNERVKLAASFWNNVGAGMVSRDGRLGRLPVGSAMVPRDGQEVGGDQPTVSAHLSASQAPTQKYARD